MRTRAMSARRQRIGLLMAVLVSVGWACGSQPIMAPTSPSSIPAPAPVPGPQRYHVSGIVTDAAGATPIASAWVTLWHEDRALDARTDANGFYSFSFNASGPYRPPFRIVPADILGLLAVGDGPDWTSLRGHWAGVYRLPWGETELVHNVRLRPVRTLAAGQSMALLVEPDSSLRWDPEFDPTFVSFDTLWEEFLVSVPTDGMLTVNVRPDGDAIPTLLCQYVGCPSFLVQGTVSIPVHAGTLYFNVQIPRVSAPQRIDIQTSLR